jgi:hypothetical protein
VPGAAMMVGSGNRIEHNCLTGNGQYAFNAYQNPGDPQQSTVTGGTQNIVLSDNEISYNGTCNWEAFGKFPVKTPAGCAGAGQFDGLRLQRRRQVLAGPERDGPGQLCPRQLQRRHLGRHEQLRLRH